jgi:hypothetical protein
MTVPFRKKDEFDTEELTTADLANTQGNVEDSPTQVEPGRMKPPRSDRSGSDAAVPRQGRAPAASEATPLFPDDQLRDLQARWNDIQTGFVDEPRGAVQRADTLVASTMQSLAEAFSRERSKLEQQWDRGDSVSTEDLRVAFQRYRSFFRRLLSL